MKNTIQLFKKISFPFFTLGLLFFSISFSPWKEYFYPLEVFSIDDIDIGILILLIILPILFLFFTIYLGIGWLKQNRDKTSEISFIHAINNRDWYSLFLLYPLTLLMEEILFRILIFSLLTLFFQEFFIAISNGFIFAIYHIHILITTKNSSLFLLFFQGSFLLGVWLSILLPYIGVWACWGLHLCLVTICYIIWYKITTKNKKLNEY